MLLANINTNSNQNINPIEKIFSPILNLNDNSYLPAVFFLILTISGNFLAETFSCSVRKILTKNFIAKHILLFCVIYFTNSINTDSKDKSSPLEKLQKSFIIYLFFIMFSKMNIFFTTVGFGILSAIYISSDYTNYILDNKKQLNSLVPYLKNILRFSLVGWTIIGFIYNVIDKKKKYKKRFSLSKFITEQNCSI